MSSTAITEKEVKEAIKGKLSRYFGVSPTEATEEQMYKACATFCLRRDSSSIRR